MKTLYGIDEPELLDDDLQECVTNYLDQLDESETPETLKVDIYKPREVSTGMFDRIYEGLEESVWEEYGNPDGDSGFPESIHKAWDAFVEVVKRDYEPWQCEPTGESITVRTAEYL